MFLIKLGRGVQELFSRTELQMIHNFCWRFNLFSYLKFSQMFLQGGNEVIPNVDNLKLDYLNSCSNFFPFQPVSRDPKEDAVVEANNDSDRRRKFTFCLLLITSYCTSCNANYTNI